MQKGNETPYPRFIANFPDGNDKFAEKAQEKVAIAISERILSKDCQSNIIGLEGEWGSGKSNVIKIIETKLSKSHHMYVHDVWSFQEDLQRRTFLESLTTHLCQAKNNEKPFQ